MLADNWKRMNIVLGMKNRFDYEEFKAKCLENDCPPLSGLEFAQKSGIMEAALIAYPEMAVADAYLLYIRNNQAAYMPPGHISSPESVASRNEPGCSSCGGGAVR